MFGREYCSGMIYVTLEAHIAFVTLFPFDRFLLRKCWRVRHCMHDIISFASSLQQTLVLSLLANIVQHDKVWPSKYITSAAVLLACTMKRQFMRSFPIQILSSCLDLLISATMFSSYKKYVFCFKNMKLRPHAKLLPCRWSIWNMYRQRLFFIWLCVAVLFVPYQLVLSGRRAIWCCQTWSRLRPRGCSRVYVAIMQSNVVHTRAWYCTPRYQARGIYIYILVYGLLFLDNGSHWNNVNDWLTLFLFVSW